SQVTRRMLAARNRTEEPRYSAEGDWGGCLRNRYPSAGYALRCGQGVPGLGWRCQELRLRSNSEYARRAFRRAAAVRCLDQKRWFLVRRSRRRGRLVVESENRVGCFAHRVELRLRSRREFRSALRSSPCHSETTGRSKDQ